MFMVHSKNRPILFYLFFGFFGLTFILITIKLHCIVFIIAASGPVRLFTPYKRRRKAQQDQSENPNSSGNGQSVQAANVTISSPVVTTNSASSTINNNTNIINNNTPTQQLHIQATPIQNNNNNTVTFNANNGIKKKRFNLNIINVKPSESSEDIESENITFTPAVTAQPSVKEEEEAVTPWQTVTEAIQEIPSDYVDQTRKFLYYFL